MSSPFERFWDRAVGAAHGAWRLPRRAIDAGQLQRLVAAGRMGAAKARMAAPAALQAAGVRPALPRASAPVLDPGRHAAIATQVSLSAGRLGRKRGLAGWLGAGSGGGKAAQAAKRLGKIATQRVVAALGRLARPQGGAAAELTRLAIRLGVDARKAPRGVSESGAQVKIGETGRAYIPAAAGGMQRSVAPVTQGGPMTRPAKFAAIAAGDAPARGSGNERSHDLQRWFGDRLARLASLPPAAASGFDTRLGPDWHAVGSLW